MGYAAQIARAAKSAQAVCALLFVPAVLFLSNSRPASAVSSQPDANTIVQRSIEALKADWQAEPKYDFHERDVNGRGSKAYQVMMILGSPYRSIEEIDGEPLSAEGKKQEQRKLDAAIARRCDESKSQTQKRIAGYNRGRERNHFLMKEMTNAFVFTELGETTINGRQAWHLRASPKPGYQPSNKETKVLTGMQGELWIDKDTYQWIQVVAQVIHTVSIEGFLARVDPGTRFKLVQAPVAGGVWFPSEFSFGSKVRVLSLIGRSSTEDETYSDYRAAESVKIPGCPGSSHAANAGS